MGIPPPQMNNSGPPPPPPMLPGGIQPRPLPAGIPLEPGKSSTDKITETIGTMAPGQLLDIMSQMKVSSTSLLILVQAAHCRRIP